MVLDGPAGGIVTPEKLKAALASEGISKHLSLAWGLLPATFSKRLIKGCLNE